MTFSDDQFNAASAFVHTMIFVDDEPIIEHTKENIPSDVKTPKRGDITAKSTDETTAKNEALKIHPLDAKGLVKSALDLGLVCSVVNPKGDEDDIATSVAKAAIRADIISLDWHMNDGDDGELATEIITKILVDDEAVGGRLRLFAIYTGNRDRVKIFKLISKRLNDSDDINDTIVEKDNALVNSTGLRLVWREKALGRQTSGAISELDLPRELLIEFSKLSTGLLGNVALAAVSSLRNSTHHVLSKFQAELDGPFFHHRAFLENPAESTNYAVSIVLSALKSEVDKSQISLTYVSPDAIKHRLEDMEKSLNNFTFRYENKAKNEQEVTLHLDEVARIVTDGYAALCNEEKRKAMSNEVNTRMDKLPGIKEIRKSLSTLFSDSSALARASMLDFSFLTNSQSSEISKIHRKSPPKLDLGSVLHSDEIGYLLCLQATCDTARGEGSFFFVPLVKDEASPDHIVPHGKTGGKPNFVCLTVPARCYTKSRTLNFGSVDPKVGHVTVNYDETDDSYHILDIRKKKYRWLANLKYKRALRTAQNVSQEMSRVGFDEFEPFRK